ncbi:MAG: hypothetical protein ACK4HD_03770 [Pannonibacter phragmitetus]
MLFDHNLSPRIPRALQALMGDGIEIIALKEKFNPSIKDIDLITALNREGGWVLISGDRRITRNKTEKSAFQSSKIIGMFLSSGLYKSPVLKQAERLIALWPAIESIAANVAPGSMFELPLKSLKPSSLR